MLRRLKCFHNGIIPYCELLQTYCKVISIPEKVKLFSLNLVAINDCIY